ncbi:hypothetical protein ACFL5Z_14955 [Planctomycetota bacterium]
MSTVELNFESTSSNKTRGQLVAKQNGEILHSDVVDIAKSKDRTAFIKDLKKLDADLNNDQINSWMLKEIERVSKSDSATSVQYEIELDNSRVVRPHLFHTPEVSGILVPVTKLSGSIPTGNWLMCTQRIDGTRECQNPERYLNLQNDERLWFNSIPNYPDANISSGWSAAGRKKWLDGYTPDVKDLYTRLIDCFDYFLEFPTDEAKGHLATLSLWTMLTYAYPAWPAVPYVSIGGPLGSGKSRVFDVLNQIVYRPLSSSNMTAPCLFRALDAQGGVLLLDEAERLKGNTPDVYEMQSILLCGYKRDGKAHRLEKQGDVFVMNSFYVYGPKAIAGINELPPALSSRCIRIVMFRAGRDSQKPRRHLCEKIQEFREIGDDLHAFSLRSGPNFLQLAQDMTVCEGLFGRDMEVWQPILALAKFVEEHGVGGLSSMLRTHADNLLEKVNEDTVPEADEILLRVVADSYSSDNCELTASEILRRAKIEDETLFRLHSPRGVGAILKRYGIRSTPTGGKRIFKTTPQQLKKIQDTYGLELDLECEDKYELEPPI